MAIKNWKKKETTGEGKWRDTNSQKEVYITKFPYKNKEFYGVMVYNPNGVDEFLGNFNSKIKALRTARKYMRSH